MRNIEGSHDVEARLRCTAQTWLFVTRIASTLGVLTHQWQLLVPGREAGLRIWVVRFESTQGLLAGNPR